MRVILTDNIGKLGGIGDIVNVKDGYARNYLFPQSKALLADDKNVKYFEHQKRLVEQARLSALKDAQAVADRISKLSFTIPRKIIEGEKIFGSVTVADIHKLIIDEGISIDRRSIELAEPIKELGIYNVIVNLASDVTAKVKVWVVEE